MANLITIDEFKNYKGINSEEFDPTISSLIASVTVFIENYTGRVYTEYSSTDKVEYFDAVSYHEYYPEIFPIISVTSLEVSTDGGVTWTPLIENTDYFVDTDNNRIISNTIYPGFIYSAIPFKSGKLTYKGGYLETPYDLKLAAMDLVQYYKESEYIPSKAMAGANQESPDVIIVGSQLPPHIKRVLDLYRII